MRKKEGKTNLFNGAACRGKKEEGEGFTGFPLFPAEVPPLLNLLVGKEEGRSLFLRGKTAAQVSTLFQTMLGGGKKKRKGGREKRLLSTLGILVFPLLFSA